MARRRRGDWYVVRVERKDMAQWNQFRIRADEDFSVRGGGDGQGKIEHELVDRLHL